MKQAVTPCESLFDLPGASLPISIKLPWLWLQVSTNGRLWTTHLWTKTHFLVSTYSSADVISSVKVINFISHSCLSFFCHMFYHIFLHRFLLFLFPVWGPLLADRALCCMLVVLSQFEYSQTVNRAMGIQFNKGKVQPTLPQSCFTPPSSQKDRLTHTFLTLPWLQMAWPWSRRGHNTFLTLPSIYL